MRSRVDYVIFFKGNVIAIFRAFWKAVGRVGPVRWRFVACVSFQRFLLRVLKRAKKIGFLSRGSFSRALQSFFKTLKRFRCRCIGRTSDIVMPSSPRVVGVWGA